MSEIGFTPGPWSHDSGIIPPDGPGRYSTISADGGDISVAEVNDLITEGSANARLIAAAPDYADACDAILEAVTANAAPVNPLAALEELWIDDQHITLNAGLVLDLLEAHAKVRSQP